MSRNVDGKYPCDQCQYKATKQDHLKDHKKAKHEDTTHFCDQCNFWTAWPRDLRKHQANKHSASQME